MNPLKPELMTADERVAEIGEILARGLIRLHARKSSSISADRGDSSVDFSPDQLRGMLRAPKVIIATWRSARPEIDGLSEAEVRQALEGLDPLWDELFPGEQARVVQLLVERVDIGVAGLKVRLRVEGLAHMVQDLAGIAAAPRRAA